MSFRMQNAKKRQISNAFVKKECTSGAATMKGKNRLVNAHILLQCGNAKHESMCAKLRDTLVSSFNEVKEADTIAPIMDKTNFCVSGIAKIDPNKRDLFVSALRSLQTNSSKGSKVKDVRVYLETI